MITISVDEKLGAQAVANNMADSLPVPGEHPVVGRDHEYKRIGTCSIVVGLGRVSAVVERKHRSREFVAQLKIIDADYPTEATIQLVWDHSFHISKETRACLAMRPNRLI